MDSFSAIIFFYFLVVCGASVMASNVTTCSCYRFYNQNSTWEESRRRCNSSGGHLVTMETEDEWEFIDSEIQKRSTSTKEWYIGLINETGVWRWINDKSVTFFKWQENEPSGDGGCVIMAKNYPNLTKGLWNDLSCATPKNFICEYDNESSMCNSSKTACFVQIQEESRSTENAVPTTACPVSEHFNLVYVVIILGILLAFGIGFYIYVFYCKNRNTGNSLRRKGCKSSKFKARTSHLQIEEGALPLQAREPTTETVLEEDSKKTSDTTTMTKANTERENSTEPQEPAQDTVEDSATQDYTLPTDPTSTNASLYSTVDIEQKKPEENEDTAPPKMPSPYHKASGEPVVYATVDKSKKTKAKDSHVQVVYATVDKTRKSNNTKDES